MKITKNLVKKFEENGYVIIPKFLQNREINQIFTELHNVINVCLESVDLGKYIDSKDLSKKYEILLKKSPKLKSHFYDMISYTEEVNILASSKKFTNLAKALLKEEKIFTNEKQIRIDHIKDSYHLAQHQELGQMSNKLAIFWIPLVDLKNNIGGLYLRPKTHKLGHLIYKNSNLEGKKAGLKRKYIIEKLFKKPHLRKYKNFYPKLKAGDAVIFHNYIFHGTMPNKNQKNARWVYITRYNSINKTQYLKNENSSINISYDADYNNL